MGSRGSVGVPPQIQPRSHHSHSHNIASHRSSPGSLMMAITDSSSSPTHLRGSQSPAPHEFAKAQTLQSLPPRRTGGGGRYHATRSCPNSSSSGDVVCPSSRCLRRPIVVFRDPKRPRTDDHQSAHKQAQWRVTIVLPLEHVSRSACEPIRRADRGIDSELPEVWPVHGEARRPAGSERGRRGRATPRAAPEAVREVNALTLDTRDAAMPSGVT